VEKKLVVTQNGAKFLLPAETREEAALKWGKAIWAGAPDTMQQFTDGVEVSVHDDEREEKFVLVFFLHVYSLDEDTADMLPTEFETSVQ